MFAFLHKIPALLRKASVFALAVGLFLAAPTPDAAEPAQTLPTPSATSVPQPAPEQRGDIFRAACESFAEAGKREASDPAAAKKLYQSAALRFEQLLGPGYENGRIYYNLGNTYYRLGDTGKAILNYRRAQILIPDDPNLLHNLARVRAQRPDQFPDPEETRILRTLLFWHYDLSTGTQRTVFAVFFLAFWAGVVLRLCLRGRKLPPAWTLWVSGVLWAAFLGSLAARPLEAAAERGGVILSPEVVARQGNGENYQPAFTRALHAGTEFSCLEKRPGWLQIALPDGKRCWIPDASAALVKP